jgi:hypothetical protein
MLTNFFRRKLAEPGLQPVSRLPAAAAARIARLTIGRHTLRLRLLGTRTADVIWAALPLHSIAETWGDSIHFDTPLKTGRDRTARLNVAPGDVCFWAEDERVVLAWGPTPISRPGEVRLMAPSNLWAETLDDPACLSDVTPGEKVRLTRAPPIRAAGAND